MAEVYKYKNEIDHFNLLCTNGISSWAYAFDEKYVGLSQMKNQFTKYKYDPKADLYPINSVHLRKSVVSASQARDISYAAGGYTWSIRNGRFLCADSRVKYAIEGRAYSSISAYMKNLAFTMCQSRIDLVDFDAGIALAELPETLAMLRRPLQSLEGFWKRFNRKVTARYRRNVRKEHVRYTPISNRRALMLDAVAGTWLQMRYGVRPLISDITDIADLVEKGINKIGPTRVYSARGSSVEEGPFIDLGDSYGYFPTAWNWPTRVRTKGVSREIRKVSYVTRYKANPWMEDAIALSRWGLSPTQILSILYELIPLSFCVDWVTNFGQWLKAIEPKPQLTVIDTCETQKWVHSFYFEHTGTMHGYTPVYGGPLGSTLVANCNDMGRTNFTNPVAPTPVFRKNGFKLLQTLDSLSLIYQRINKGVQRYVGKKFRHL